MSGSHGNTWCKLQHSSGYLRTALQSLCDCSFTCTAANLNLSRCTAAPRIWLHERQHSDSQDEADTAPSHPKRGRRFQSFFALGRTTNANNSESRNLEWRAKGQVRAESGRIRKRFWKASCRMPPCRLPRVLSKDPSPSALHRKQRQGGSTREPWSLALRCRRTTYRVCLD